jgi:hypothetical protein
MSVMVRKSTGAGEVKAPILKLVPRHNYTDVARSAETAQALREMADMAERGEIQGLAYVVIRPQRKVAIGRVGAARQDSSLVSYWLQKLNLILLNG